MRARPRLIHVTTTDMSLVLLLGPQLRAFSDAGYDVIGASAAGDYAGQLAGWGVTHYPLRHATRAMALHRDVLALAELRTLFRSSRPDIVHTHNPKPGLYGRAAARAANVPAIVNTVHGLYAVPEDRLIKRAGIYGLERLAAACSHAELVQNPEDLAVLLRLGIPQHKLHLLGNGIDLDRFDPGAISPPRVAAARASIGAGPGTVVCGAVGRLVAEKGYRDLFEAAARLRTSFPELHFIIVGPEDPDKPDAINQAEFHRAQARAALSVCGFSDDVEELYAAMDIYVLASHREGFPRSAMEAAAMGLPIVATDIRGCRQVVEHGRTGLLVPARDPTALAAAIARLAGDQALRRAFGAAGREKALREFSDRKVIQATLQVYERLGGRAVPAVS